MLSVLPNQVIPTKFSKKKVLCQCSCGNPQILEIRYNSFSRRNPTCGQCELFKWKQSGIKQYGRLSLLTDYNEITALRNQVLWQCECGNQKRIAIFRVISGNTRSCGCLYFGQPHQSLKYPKKSAATWLSEIPELINENLPHQWSLKTRLKPKFQCECGKIFSIDFNRFKTGVTKCGKCSWIELKSGQTINNFIYHGETKLVNPISQNSIKCQCEKCLKEISTTINIFFKARIKCKECNSIIVNKDDKFGKLKIKKPGKYQKYSTKKTTWICVCGNETQAIISNVLNGTTKSCGKCKDNVNNWFETNKNKIRNLKYPVEPISFPTGGPILNGTVKNYKPFSAICPICKSEYFPRFFDIKRGKSLTCGCSFNRTSAGQLSVGKFLESLEIEVKYEFKVNGLKYDILIPKFNLLVEYNGLKWHSFSGSKTRDIRKYRNAINNGYGFISIYEDEWIKKPKIIENIFRNKIKNNTLGLRPSQCEIKQITNKEVNILYESYHYIGKCSSKINYGVFYQNQLIAAISFGKPTRQTSKYEWELLRMCSHPDHRVHGIWSKLLKLFIKEYNPKSVVSFSDNRLFNGNVYEKIGFKYNGKINPDYYWIKGQSRFHKSGLRKTKEEISTGLTETQLREQQGFTKIWDLGKKRWVLNLW